MCQQSSTSISLANCLLEDKSIDYSGLHLNDQACKGQMDNLTHMVMFKVDGNNTCGTVVMVGTFYFKLLLFFKVAAKLPFNTRNILFKLLKGCREVNRPVQVVSTL